MTTGSPPSMTATQELVVPRSMPITFAIVYPPYPLAFLYFNRCLLLFYSPAGALAIITRDGRSNRSLSRKPFCSSCATAFGGRSRRFHLADRFVPGRIEGFADSGNPRDTEFLQNLVKLAKGHLHPLQQPFGAAFFRVLNGPFQIVDGRQKLAQNRFVGEAGQLLLVPLRPLAEVIQLGLRTQKEIPVLLPL